MTQTVWLTIDWREADGEMPEAQQETVTELLFREMNGFDEVERVERVADPAAPAGGMGAAWLWSILTTEVTIANLKRLGQEVQERLPGKPMSFSLKCSKDGDVEFSVENVRPEEFEEKLNQLVEAAEKLKQRD